MVACPYDQLFIDPNTHTAEKCNVCANRVENQLLPACVSVCPTECRIFGDLDDPASEVAQIAQRQATSVRKPEKGTIPKVFYIGAEESAIQPELAVRPFIYKEGQVLLRPLGSPSPDGARPGDARVDYDVPHEKAWGVDMALYLLTKGIATGTMLVSVLLFFARGDRSVLITTIGPAISLLFLIVTAVLLIADLERPERFYYILIRPNWRSWMVWGAYFLAAQGAITAFWLLAAVVGGGRILSWLVWPAVVASLLTTCYTAFLFAQGLARDLWQGPQSVVDLLAQAVVEGAAALMLAALVTGGADPGTARTLSMTLAGAMLVHIALIVFENVLMPSPTRHHELATSAIRRGPFARVFWGGAIACALVSVVVALAGAFPPAPLALAAAALLALGGSFAWEYVWVEAGQSVPLS
jgi:formate-dependent nitrite reductase membrane component NrfD